MAHIMETPSRIWRRIEAVEDRDMPSLPSLPQFEDDSESLQETSSASLNLSAASSAASPIQSTPAPSSHASSYRGRDSTATLSMRPPASAARFASSIASRSTKSSHSRGLRSSANKSQSSDSSGSFDISLIPSLPAQDPDSIVYSDEEEQQMDEVSRESVGEAYLPPQEPDQYEDISMVDEEGHISAAALYEDERSPRKKYDEYSVSLQSEPKASPFDKFRNVALRRPLARTRTPSLSRTTPSPLSSPTHSTPRSNMSITFRNQRSNAASPVPRLSRSSSPLPGVSIPLPRSTTNSPAIIVRGTSDDGYRTEELQSQSEHEYETNSIHPEASEDDHTPRQLEEQRHISRSRSVHFDTDLPESESDNPDENYAAQTSTSEAGGAEPTFSSDEAPTPQNHGRNQNNSAFTSPAQSATFTPTPAFRSRARLNTPESHSQEAVTEEKELATDETVQPLTPYSRRRSFLLSVINSTARPRLKFPTPHPRAIAAATPSSSASSGLVSSANSTGSLPIISAVKPRIPTPRASHPLAQSFDAPSTANSSSSHENGQVRSPSLSPAAAASLPPWSTPNGPRIPRTSTSGTPFDAQSFISTASSHDLTTHHRANASFDPAMGFGAQQGHGLGRFNTAKLNSYLHGLNRRLQEENEILLARLRAVEEGMTTKADNISSSAKSASTKADTISSSAKSASFRRNSTASATSRRQSGLVDVAEDVSGEGWIEEKASLEELISALSSEKEALEADLQLEKEGRKADKEREKERLRERMEEVQQGMEKIVMGQDEKLHEAQQKLLASEHEWADHLREVERRILDIQAERDEAVSRADKAEQVMESDRELGGELREANERVGQALSDLRNANFQIKELEDEVMKTDSKVDELEKLLKEEQDVATHLEEDLNANAQELADVYKRVQAIEKELAQADEELRESKSYVAELESDAGAALERIEAQEEAIAEFQDKIEQLELEQQQSSEKMEQLQGDADRAAELARQMEEALDAAENKMLADEEEVVNLKSQVTSLERERERLLERSVRTEPSLRDIAPSGPTEEDLEALEEELDAANREIGRLTTLVNQSPARKAIDKAKDAKIELLEREKDDLLERVQTLRSTVNDSRMNVINTSGISPIHRQVLSMNVRAPRTPGGPLRDMSWLNSTHGDHTTSPLVAEISRLQRELDRANDSIDDKLDKLEDTGFGVVGLTKRLEDARSKIIVLEEEIARLCRREDRRIHRLERARCKKCLTKVDLKALTEPENETSYQEISDDSTGLATEPPTPPTRTTEALRANLRSVNADLATMRNQWETQKHQLLGEKAVLQDAASKLNVQVRNAQEEAKRATETGKVGEKMRAGVQSELEKAQQVIADLEADLQSERARLRSSSTEQDRIARDKNNVLVQLQRTESDMNEVKQQLQDFKQQNHELEEELRVNANADQKARLLEDKVVENADTIEQLREERSLLVTDHKELQRRFSELSEHANRLRDEHTKQQNSHDNRRHQLDMHLAEIDDLRRALSDQASELERTAAEKDKIAAEKSTVARTVSVLTADLKSVQRDAEMFGRDLKVLRRDKERLELKQKDDATKAERTKKQTTTQIRLLNEQLDNQKEKTARAREELKNHICAISEQQLVSLKQQHGKECKGLFVQLAYLKAKFVREAKFREALVNQKQYLLLLLAKCDQSDRNILIKVAEIGFPLLPTPTKSRSLKAVATSIVFISRTKLASQRWQEESASKEAVASAHEDLRRRRRIVSS